MSVKSRLSPGQIWSCSWREPFIRVHLQQLGLKAKVTSNLTIRYSYIFHSINRTGMQTLFLSQFLVSFSSLNSDADVFEVVDTVRVGVRFRATVVWDPLRFVLNASKNQIRYIVPPL